jgi:WD40 repeat protein
LALHLNTHSDDPATLDISGCTVDDIAYTKVLAIACHNGPIQLWDDSKRLNDITADTGRLENIEFSPDGTVLAGGGLDGDVRVWPVGGGSPETLRTQGDPVGAIAFSGDGTMLAVATTSTIVCWNIRTHQQLFDIQARANLLKFSSDNQALVLPAANGSLFYDLKGNRIKTINGTTLWAASNPGGGASIYDVTKPYATTTLAGNEAVKVLAFGPNHTFATYGTSESIKIWNTTTPAQPTKTVPSPAVDLLRFNTTGTRLAAYTYAKVVLYTLDS